MSAQSSSDIRETPGQSIKTETEKKTASVITQVAARRHTCPCPGWTGVTRAKTGGHRGPLLLAAYTWVGSVLEVNSAAWLLEYLSSGIVGHQGLQEPLKALPLKGRAPGDAPLPGSVYGPWSPDF